VAEADAAGDLTGAEVRLSPESIAMGLVRLETPAADPYRGWFIVHASATSPSDVYLVVRSVPPPDVPPPC
jgi:hypothetical protein